MPIQPSVFPKHVRVDLIHVAEWLYDHGRDEYLTVYGKIRGNVLQRSLSLLKDHQRSVSGGSVHGTAGSPLLVSVNIVIFL